MTRRSVKSCSASLAGWCGSRAASSRCWVARRAWLATWAVSAWSSRVPQEEDGPGQPPPGVAALGGVQGAVADAGDQARGCRRRMFPGTGVTEEHLVFRAGEGDRQVPGPFPGAAVLFLDRAAVPGQALRAVAGHGAEQPVVDLRRSPRQCPGNRRVAVGPGRQRQRFRLVRAEPGGLGEGSRVEVEQQAAAERGAVASDPAGQLDGAEAEPVGKAQQVSAEGLAGEGVVSGHAVCT